MRSYDKRMYMFIKDNNVINFVTEGYDYNLQKAIISKLEKNFEENWISQFWQSCSTKV